MTIACPAPCIPAWPPGAPVGPELEPDRHPAQFYVKPLASIGDLFASYRIELIRLIAQMGLGSGALAVIGGTVVIVGFLTMAGARCWRCRATTL